MQNHKGMKIFPGGKLLILYCLCVFTTSAALAQTQSLAPLRQELTTLTAQYKAGTGIAMILIESGDTLSLANNHRYPMQSVYKFPLALAVLDRVDKGELKPDQKIYVKKSDLKVTWSPLRDKFPEGNIGVSIADLIGYSVSQSDNNACDILFREVGGPKKVHDYIQSLGKTDIAIQSTEEEMHKNHDLQYRNYSTPFAMARLLEGFWTNKYLSDSSTAFLKRALTDTSTGPKRIKGLLPEGTPVAHKTGSSGQDNNGVTAATNDVGIITLPDGRHLILVVFVCDSREDDATNERIIAEVAKTVYSFFAE
jgi:beta-lactamase class A